MVCILGRVIPIVYSRLATSLRSLAVILPIHLHLLLLGSTLPTVFLWLPYIWQWGQIQPHLPIHWYGFFSIHICFACMISRLYPFSNAGLHRRIKTSPSKSESEAWLLQNLNYHHSIIQLSQFRVPETSSETNWLQNTSLVPMRLITIHPGHDYSTLPTREIEYDRYIRVCNQLLPANWGWSSVGEHNINNAIVPMNWQCREVSWSWETINKSAQLQLHTFWLSVLHQPRLPWTATIVATLQKPTCAGIPWPLTPTEEDEPTKDALILSQTSAWAKSTYRD